MRTHKKYINEGEATKNPNFLRASRVLDRDVDGRASIPSGRREEEAIHTGDSKCKPIRSLRVWGWESRAIDGTKAGRRAAEEWIGMRAAPPLDWDAQSDRDLFFPPASIGMMEERSKVPS